MCDNHSWTWTWTCAAVALAGCPMPPGPATPAPRCVAATDDPAGRGEGMWPVGMLGALDEEDLRARGLAIPLGDLWTDGAGGLAQAAVAFGGGCSASFVSPDGLIVTNHHCAFRTIARNSTPERNIVEDGFIAASRAEELPGRGTKIQVLRSWADVTDRIVRGLPEEPLERIRGILRREAEVVAECEADAAMRCHVARFNDGVGYVAPAGGEGPAERRFVLFRAFEVRDVRLVAAPPLSVGEYGGEADNWRWPRHTNDFAFLRAYVAPDGGSADYAEENVPYRPAHRLAVSTEGVAAGDLVFVMGYPIRTDRRLTAAEIEEQRDWYYPQRLDLLGEWIAELEAAAERSEDARIRVSSMLKAVHNGRSHASGVLQAMRRNRLLDARLAEEAAFLERLPAYGAALDGIAAAIAGRQATRDADEILRYLPKGSQVFGFAWTIVKWAMERAKPDGDREPGFQDRDERDIRTAMREAQASLDLDADRMVLAMLLRRAAALPEGRRIAGLDAVLGAEPSAEEIDAFARRAYGRTALGEPDGRLATFGRGLEEIRGSDDEMVRLALALAPAMDAQIDRARRLDERLAALRPVVVEGLAAFRGRPPYPDANRTLRLTFGAVRGYVPADGAVHAPFTTLAGLIEKETGVAPFASPPAVLEAIRARRLGPWLDPALGDVPVNFLSDADTTGGNSGSPVLDGSGRLVGLLFDGVWENLTGDFAYSPARSRSIIVDLRYVLWHLDCVAGARALLDELGAGGERSCRNHPPFTRGGRIRPHRGVSPAR